MLTFASDVFLNRWTRGRSLTEMMVALQAAGQNLQRKFERYPDARYNRRVLSHIVGIERWGQRRLRVALGDPFELDEYDGYRPSRETDVTALRQMFAETRRETIRLIGLLDRAKVGDARIKHNKYGDLTVRGWLRYLLLHANLEAYKLRS
ncbi:MAG: DinB family protein [Anaerolineae bacterium]|nr:DinB family protein [Anaerolineae bacterium]